MSTKAYSTDLRTRVIRHIEQGNSQLKTAMVFSVSKSAVGRWWIRYKQEGSLKAKPFPGSKGKVDTKALEAYVRANPNQRLQDIALVFKVSGTAIWKRLKVLGYSYKKKRTPTWKRTKKSESLI